MPHREVVSHLELLLDGPERFDLALVGDVFVVTPKLQRELEMNAIEGVQFRPMEVGPSENFDPADNDELPHLVQMSVVRIVEGPSGWWVKEGTCDLCGRASWGGGDGASEALSSLPGELLGPPRQIFAHAWRGEDVFWTDDPGPPLVTERVKEILDRFETPELILHPAVFT